MALLYTKNNTLYWTEHFLWNLDGTARVLWLFYWLLTPYVNEVNNSLFSIMHDVWAFVRGEGAGMGRGVEALDADQENHGWSTGHETAAQDFVDTFWRRRVGKQDVIGWYRSEADINLVTWPLCRQWALCMSWFYVECEGLTSHCLPLSGVKRRKYGKMGGKCDHITCQSQRDCLVTRQGVITDTKHPARFLYILWMCTDIGRVE